MENTITVTRIDNIHSFEALRNDWSTLIAESAEKDVFLTWEWLFAWWKNIGQTSANKLWLLTVRNGNRLIGIAPLMLNTKRKAFITLRRLENIGNPECDVSGIISIEPEKTTSAIINYLRIHSREWDLLEINELSQSSQATQHLLIAIKKSHYGLIKDSEEHFYIPIDGKWEEYYNGLSKNLRHNLKRRKKRAEEMGNMTFNQFSGDTLTWETFQTIFSISEKSNFPDLYKSASNRSFHKDLFELMRETGWMQVEILSIQGKPVAFQYGFAFDGKYEDWRGGIDKEYETLAPGKLLMMLSLEKRFETRVRENDFLRGIYSYKLDWLPSPREFINIQVFNIYNIISRIAYYWAHYLKNKIHSISTQHD